MRSSSAQSDSTDYSDCVQVSDWTSGIAGNTRLFWHMRFSASYAAAFGETIPHVMSHEFLFMFLLCDDGRLEQADGSTCTTWPNRSSSVLSYKLTTHSRWRKFDSSWFRFFSMRRAVSTIAEHSDTSVWVHESQLLIGTGFISTSPESHRNRRRKTAWFTNNEKLTTPLRDSSQKQSVGHDTAMRYLLELLKQKASLR